MAASTTSVAVPCSPATLGLSAPLGKAHCLWQMQNSRGNWGQKPPTNQFVIPPVFLGIALQPAWRSVHGGHKLSFFQVTFLSRKIWKPSSLTQLQVCYHSTYQVNDIKWGPVTGLEELFGNIWGQTGKAMQMLGFSVALSEIDSIGLEKSKIFFDLALKEKAAWEVSSGYLLGMS